jgi:hypothetical protein
MKRNVGSIDRGLRFGLGLLLVLLALSTVIGPWGYVGIVLIATSAWGFCPIYTMIDFESLRWGSRDR